jgi:sugar lactone lactonase YvrE
LTFEQERTGRLLKYEPSTQQTTVLAKDLYYPNGVAVAKDSTFLLVSLTSKSRFIQLLLLSVLQCTDSHQKHCFFSCGAKNHLISFVAHLFVD